MPGLGLRKPHVCFAGCSLLGSAISGTRRRDWKAVTEKGCAPSCLLDISEINGPGMARHLISNSCFQPPAPSQNSTAHLTLSPQGSSSSCCTVPCLQASWFWPLRLHLHFPQQPLSGAPYSDIGAQSQGVPPVASRFFPVFLQLKGPLLPLSINSTLPPSSLYKAFSVLPTLASPIPYNKYPVEIASVVSVLLTRRWLLHSGWSICVSSFAQCPGPIPNSLVWAQ